MNLTKPKKHLALFLVLPLALLALSFIRADDDSITKIITQLNKWADNNPQEKVYLQLDKPYYASGESIWFKAYVTVGPQHQLSALSKLLNVELIDERDSVKQSVKLPIESGITWGDFALNDTLQAGNYRIRAYTNYMRNAGEAYFFDKVITIGNVIDNTVLTDADYHYATVNGRQQITADIIYKDLKGNPYVAKNVSYVVQLDTKDAARGKGVTDEKGMIHVTFTSNAANPFKNGRISTTITYEDKKTAEKDIPVKASSSKVDVQFFPEGGTLVAGLPSRIAFKATNPDGLGAVIKGSVTDNENNEITPIETKHLGMGYFTLLPEAGKTYKANITYTDGSQSTVPLPAATASGYQLAVTNNESDALSIRVATTADIAQAANGKLISIVAQQNGVVCYAAKSNINNQAFAARVAKSKFHTGIVQFTLFDVSGQPVAERLVFIQNNDLLNINVGSDKQAYAPREKVTLSLGTVDAGNPAVAALSAAVTDETKVTIDEGDETTILSSILLTSDLKGYIEKPNYYFAGPTAQTHADLDILMMTQGYRRFVWKDLLNDVFQPLAFKPEKSLNIAGTIKKSGKPVPGAKVMMISPGSSMMLVDTVADANGHFSFDNLIFADSLKVAIQARTDKGKKDVDIVLDGMTKPVTTPDKNAPDVQISISKNLNNYLVSSKDLYREQIKYGQGDHNTMLKEVVIRDKPKPKLENSSNLNGAGNADMVVKSTDLMTCPTLDMCLQGKVPFVNFMNGQAYSTRSPNTPMQIIVDGIYMDPDYLGQVNPQDVSSVEVLRTPGNTAIYGSRGGAGVLVINLKKGAEMNDRIIYSPGILAFRPQGYYRAREFYAPRYDDPKVNKQMADLRSTIYWKPSITTSKDGKATIDYFNADGKGSYKVVVEGIDGDGNVGRTVYRYKVQ